jgi:hypothetical protein
MGLSVILALAIVRELRQRSTALHGSATPSGPVEEAPPRTVRAALLFILCYFGVIIGSRALADPFIEFHARMLLPALVVGQVAFAVVATQWARTALPVVRWAALGVVAAWLAMSARVTVATITRERQAGLDVVRPPVRESGVLDWLRANNTAGRLVFSNHPLAVHHLLSRDARWWPKNISSDTLREFSVILRQRNGLIVSFDARDQWVEVADDSSLVRVMGLRSLASLPDGSVWELAQ